MSMNNRFGLEESVLGARRSVRKVLITVATLRITAWVVMGLIVLGLLDYVLRLPPWIRWTHFVAGIVTIVWLVRTRLMPAFRFSPSLTTVALEIETRRPELGNKLASSLDLSDLSESATGIEKSLASLAVTKLASLPQVKLLHGKLNTKSITRISVVLIGLLALVLVSIAQKPVSVKIATVRTVAPWSGVEWPKRTAIEDVTAIRVHPRGETVPLSVALTRTNKLPENTDVTVRTRLYRDGSPTKNTRALAGWQKRKAHNLQSAAEGELFEVLADTGGESLEYRFETYDNQTEWARIELIERPEVLSATAQIRRPDYVIATAPSDEPDTINANLGTGLDERAAAPVSLVGSFVSLTLTLNKPVEIKANNTEWMTSTLGTSAADIHVNSQDQSVWTIDFELTERAVFRVSLTDEYGIDSEETAVFRFDVEIDQPPSVVMIDPAFDDTALPGAVVDYTVTAHDDVALASLWTSVQRFVPDGTEPSGRSGAVRAADDAKVLERAAVSAGDLRAQASGSINLGQLEAEPGDEFHLWGTAVDVFAFETGLREPTQSALRRVFIISEEEFVDEIRDALSGIRRETIRLFETQQGLLGRSQRGQASAEDVRREQDAIAQDIQRQAERAKGLQEQINSNRLDDDELTALTEDAAQLAQTASASSTDASQAAQGLDGAEVADSEEISVAQENTLDDLGELIALLDSGKDAWTARRNLEQLLKAQKENLEATRELARETAGLEREDLNEEQQTELDRITDRQQELAERSQDATEGLRDSQENLKENDPSAAAALGDAAESLEQAEVSQNMQEAAEQAQENRTARSAALQQEAVEQLEDAIEELDNAKKNRNEQLRRVAQSLVETIEGLVVSQRTEIDRFAQRIPDLSPAMIALHTRTIAAAELARSQRELRQVARPLDTAATSQLHAVTALRAAQLDADVVERAERASLAALIEALEEASRLQDQIEQEAVDQQRKEIKEAYKQALKEQVELRDRTQQVAPNENPNRRARAELRKLAQEQRDISSTIHDLKAETQELEDAVVFRFVHTKLDEALSKAHTGLEDSDSREALRAQGRVIALLRSLIEALEDDQDGEENFEDGGAGGGGGGGQSGEPELIPGGAQLKLLRAIQADLLERTRAIDEGTDSRTVLQEVGSEQRELSDIGQTLIDELTTNQPEQIIEEQGNTDTEGAAP